MQYERVQFLNLPPNKPFGSLPETLLFCFEFTIQLLLSNSSRII
jgi:hypothetical protein